MKEDPQNPLGHYNLGVIHAKNQDMAKAVESWEKARKLDPKDDKTLASLGLAYEQLGEKDKALNQLTF